MKVHLNRNNQMQYDFWDFNFDIPASWDYLREAREEAQARPDMAWAFELKGNSGPRFYYFEPDDFRAPPWAGRYENLIKKARARASRQEKTQKILSKILTYFVR